MPINSITSLHQAHHAMLRLIASLSGCAVGLYEPGPDGQVREVLPPEGFEPYCRKIQALRSGQRLCHEDHIRRAKEVFDSKREALTLCHAGVFNQALPIVIKKKVRAVLMYGQMQVTGDRRSGEAKRRHKRLVETIGMGEDDQLELMVYYDEVKKLSQEDLKTLNEQLSLLQRFFYGMLSEGLELDWHTEIMVHDIQTRLQPILAHAQKLHLHLKELSTSDSSIEVCTDLAGELLNNVSAMRVPVWNLGEFMPHYQFERYRVSSLVEEAIALYRAEAERKEVDFRIHLEEPSGIEMSRTHMQHVINNLVHNAIKYSFYGGYRRDRFVEIRGDNRGFDYTLTFSNYGVGIQPKELDLIFKPGYKGELTHKEYRSGSGMGLAVAREVIDRHNGTIEAESFKMGREAHLNRFIVRLPRIHNLEEKEEK